MNARKLYAGIVGGLAVILLLWFWYDASYSMGVAPAYEVNPEVADKQLLIATQQSTYKDALTTAIEAELAHLPVRITVVDVTEIRFPLRQPPTACILLHTWEMWQPEPAAVAFRDKLPPDTPLFVISTSGSGEEFLEGDVDGISSASEIATIESDIKVAVAWAKLALGFPPEVTR